jgi:outer membrane lipoprotein carrier protein
MFSQARTVAYFSAALAAIAVAFAAVSGALAAGTERFAQFVGNTSSGKAAFEQKVYNRDNKLVQESRGSFLFARPGKFRWTYEKPYSQLIVGDGSRVWIYDEDLKQATVKPMGQALTSTPAALLAGNNDVMKSFAITDQGRKDGLDWIEAVPKDREGGFERIRMAFGAGGPEVMELSDAFGQRTVLRFTGFERNARIDPAMFRFTPPKGADVIGDQRGDAK